MKEKISQNYQPDKASEWLFEEYKIIQSKIDKLGEDKFKVRSWCVTLVSGLLIAAKVLSTALIPILSFSLLTVFLFHLVEHRQRSFGRKLGSRAHDIEVCLQRMQLPHMQKELRELKYVPQIARMMIFEAFREQFLKINWKRPTTLWDWLVIRADNIFYLGQYVALFVALVWVFFSVGSSANNVQPSASNLFSVTNNFSFSVPNQIGAMTNFVVTNIMTTNFIRTNIWTTNFLVTNIWNTNI